MARVESREGPGELVLAAGGIVERHERGCVRIAAVYRERYGGEWSLPKGKQEPGESIENTALREVEEETGCPVRLTGFAGCTHYRHGNVPKVVLYWRMVLAGPCAFRPSEEVRAVGWLTPEEAEVRLAHSDEIDLLKKIYGLSARP